MLQVADQLLAPIEEVDRAVRRATDGGGAEVRVVGLDQVFERFSLETGTILRHLHAENPLKANHIAVEEIPLPVVGKMPAADHAGAGAGAAGASPELGHARVLLRIGEIATEGGGEEVLVAGGIGNDVVPPAVEDPAVWVGKAVADVLLELAGQRLKAEDATVVAADDSLPRFHLGAVENAVGEVCRAAGVEDHRVRRMVAVGGVDPHQHPLFPVRLIVPVGVPHEPQIGSLHQQHAILEKREAGRAIEIVDKWLALVGFAITVCVFKNQNRVPNLAGRRSLGITLPSRHPEPPFRVPGHLHWADQFRELLLTGKEIDFAVFGDGHVLDRLFRP